MISRTDRNRLAENLRHLATGQITNREFEESCEQSVIGSSGDPAISEIEHRLVWPQYDDFHRHTLSGEHALTDGIRKDFARAILFLKTDLEYEWQIKRGIRGFINSTFRIHPFCRTPPVLLEDGPVRYWPFYRKSDYLEALKNPRYLQSNEAQQGAAANP